MLMTDPIADMLTRIRNAHMKKHESVTVPLSRLKLEIARILKEEGFIRNYKVEGEGVKKNIIIALRYTRDEEPAIVGLKRVSKPGRRIYTDKDSIPRVMGGIGIAILSTSKGIMTDRKARKEGVGGEVLCYVW